MGEKDKRMMGGTVKKVSVRCGKALVEGGSFLRDVSGGRQPGAPEA